MTQLTGPSADLRRSRGWALLIAGTVLLSATSLTVVLLAPVLEPAFRG